MQNCTRIDRLGDVFASGILAAVRNPTERRILFANALLSRSDEKGPHYREHWHSDQSIARKIGSTRQTVNTKQNELRAKGIIARIETKAGCTRRTAVADYNRPFHNLLSLADVAEAHGGQAIDIRTAPRPAGKDFPRFPDEVLESGILKRLPNIAGELLMLYAWLANPDPEADDFGQYSIRTATAAAILHRAPRNVRDAQKTLTDANLITRDGKKVTLLAHTAAEFAARRTAKSAQAYLFTDEDKARCQAARKKADQVMTGQEKTKTDQVMTGRRIRSRQVGGSGHDRWADQVTTQTTIEPQQITIRNNHRRASGAGEGAFWNDSDRPQVNGAPAPNGDGSVFFKRGGPSPQTLNGSPPAYQDPNSDLQEHQRLVDVLVRPPVTPEDHARQDEARAQLRALTRAKPKTTLGPNALAEPPAASKSDEPQGSHVQAATRERKERLLELLENKTGSTQQYNAIIKRIKAQVDKVPDVDAFLDSCIERVDEIIAAATPQPTTESQGQDAEAGTREGRFNQMRRRRRGHREREPVDTWTTAPAPPQPQAEPEPQAQTAGEMEKPAAEPEPQENAQTGGDEKPDRLWQVKEAEIAYRKAQVDTIHQRRQRRQARSSPNPWQERRKPQGGSLPMT